MELGLREPEELNCDGPPSGKLQQPADTLGATLACLHAFVLNQLCLVEKVDETLASKKGEGAELLRLQIAFFSLSVF